jgi:hypothetical protein
VDHEGARLAQQAPWLWTVYTGRPQEVAVAIAVPRGAMMEGRIACGWPVFAMNPKPLDRFRDLYSMAGATDDRREACVCADALRTDPPRFLRLRLEEPPCIGAVRRCMACIRSCTRCAPPLMRRGAGT